MGWYKMIIDGLEDNIYDLAELQDLKITGLGELLLEGLLTQEDKICLEILIDNKIAEMQV